MLDPIAEELYAEVHARPFPRIVLPCCAWQISIKTSVSESRQVIKHFYALNNNSAPRELPEKNNMSLQMGNCEVRLELHREFCSFLFIFQNKNTEDILNEKPPYSKAWLEGLPGILMICNSIKFIPELYREIDKQRMQEYFEGQRVVGSYVLEKQATVWTSFRLHDQSARYVAFVGDLTDSQTGYLLQQLVELETYRIMALFGFPMAKSMVLELGAVNDSLADILRRLPDAQHFAEQELLLEITNLSAQLEAMQAESTNRFAATQAYYELVNERLINLNEDPFEEISTLSTFLGRRLAPAMRTCEAIHEELLHLSARVGSASSLLQARVSVAMEDQNRELLESMDQRGDQQLRLQETVEGLSVAAITYYIVGLLDKVFSLNKHLPWSVDSKVITALSIVPVALLVWLSVRRVRKKISSSD